MKNWIWPTSKCRAKNKQQIKLNVNIWVLRDAENILKIYFQKRKEWLNASNIWRSEF